MAMGSRVTVYNYGSVNIDQVYRVPHLVAPGETLSSLSLTTLLGGKGANQSVALARAGASVRHVGRIGQADGWVAEELARSGVDISLIQAIDGASGHAIIQVDDHGENSIILHGGANQSFMVDAIEEALSQAVKGDWLLLQNECNDAASVIELALQRGLSVAFNPAPMTMEVAKLPLSRLSVLVLNEPEALALADALELGGGPDALSTELPLTRIVLTLGAQGARQWLNGASIDVPARKVETVDTTGAGDTFVGYLLAALIDGLEDGAAMDRACAAAALSVTRPGATPSIPAAAEVNQFL